MGPAFAIDISGYSFPKAMKLRPQAEASHIHGELLQVLCIAAHVDTVYIAELASDSLNEKASEPTRACYTPWGKVFGAYNRNATSFKATSELRDVAVPNQQGLN